MRQVLGSISLSVRFSGLRGSESKMSLSWSIGVNSFNLEIGTSSNNDSMEIFPLLAMDLRQGNNYNVDFGFLS
jgi:hypothetical protein